MSQEITREYTLNHIAKNVIKTADGCHEWQLSLTKDGYGQITNNHIFYKYGIKGIHRLIVHLVHGFEFTSRHQQVMHSCHNRRCCNPDHLSVGTASENMAAARARGSFKGNMLGEHNPNAKLTRDDVREIKKMILFGYSNAYISPFYPQVDSCSISSIRHGRSWKTVTIDESEVDFLQLCPDHGASLLARV